MTEVKKKIKESDEENDRWSFVPYVVEQMFGTAEKFVGRLTDIATGRAELFVNRAIQRLFLLFLLGVGITLFLFGGADAINGLVNFPGVGQMVVGTFILLVTGIMILSSRRRT